MHYYQFNIGDYSAHTSRLSPIKDIAYRRILDLYYLNERPLSGCSADVCCEIGMEEYQNDVEFILNKYFILDDNEWRNKRVDKEICNYKKKSEQAKKAGIASGKARKIKACERMLNEKRTDAEPTNNHKPITINHKPINKKKSDLEVSKLTPSDVVDLYNKRFYGTNAVQKIKLTESLKRSIRSFIKSELKTISDWNLYFDNVEMIPFLMGKIPPSNGHRQFRLSIEWLIKPANLTKIIEGFYTNA